ncbi:unnamed protein product [Boreogadus saida]
MVELSLGLHHSEPGAGRAAGQLHALCSKASERYPQDTIYVPDIHFSRSVACRPYGQNKARCRLYASVQAHYSLPVTSTLIGYHCLASGVGALKVQFSELRALGVAASTPPNAALQRFNASIAP